MHTSSQRAITCYKEPEHGRKRYPTCEWMELLSGVSNRERETWIFKLYTYHERERERERERETDRDRERDKA